MAKSITFMGAPKPMGATGHFDEPVRHSLQAKGILTGNLANNPAVYEQWGITNLENKSSLSDLGVPKTSTGLEDVEAEAKASKPKPKESLTAKFKRMEKELEESMRREQKARAEKRKKEMYDEVGREPPAEKDTDGDFSSDEFDAESVPAKVGHFLADLTGDYSSEEMVGLNNKELEMLAVRFHSQAKDGLFGEPENPFVSELKRRMESEAMVRRQKAEVMSQINNPQRERGFLADLFTDEPEPQPKRTGASKGLIQDVLGDDEPTPTRAPAGEQGKGFFKEFFDL